MFRVVSLSGLVAVGATLTSNLLAQPGTLGDPATFLPPGARVEDPARHVILEDLDGDGKEEAVIFYQKAEEDRRTAGVVVLAHEGNDYGQVWSREKEPSRGAIDPSGVKNLLGTSTPQIVAFWGIGASCQGVLEIFQYDSGKVVPLAGDWGEGGTCQNYLELADLDRDGKSEIVFKEYRYGVNPSIYRWDGKQYALANERFPKVYGRELPKVLAAFESREAYPPQARAKWARQVIEVYMLQKKYSEAAALARRLIDVLDDDRLTPPPARGPRQTFRSERLRAKAGAHELLAKTLESAGAVRGSGKSAGAGGGAEG